MDMGKKLLKSLILSACLLFGVTAGTLASEPGYEAAPAAEWIIEQSAILNSPAPREELSNGTYFRLYSRQQRISKGHVERYRRFVYEILNGEGIERESSISVDYDPEYERVIFHKINLIRDGKIINQLDLSKIHSYQREEDLEKLVYDGRQTLHLLLEDVRIGDIVDYSYTKVGHNPALKGIYFRGIGMGWGVPLGQAYARVIWDEDRPLFTHSHQMDLEPQISETPYGTEYVWDWHNSPAVEDKDSSPDWYNPYPWIQISDAKSWADVVAFETPIFVLEQPLTPELEELVAKIRVQHSTPGDQMVAALRFVQDEIRYVHISKGTGGYIPNSLTEIMTRRYGDCKDKTVLLLALLKALEIEAHPVLAELDYGPKLDQMIPSSAAFDHVFVQAILEDKTYWLDGTMTHQKGDFEHLFQPDFGYVLPLKPGVEGLQLMQVAQDEKPARDIKVKFDMSQGADAPGSMEIKTLFRGDEANYIRNRIAADGLKQLQQDYLEYYGDYYTGLSASKPFQVNWNDDQNEVTLTEYYSLPGLWEKEGSGWDTWIYHPEIRNSLDYPGDLTLKVPFEIFYPNHVRLTSEVTLPEAIWEPEKATEQVENEFFILTSEKEFSAEKLTRILTYRPKMDHVPSPHLTRYQADVLKARDISGAQYLSYGVETAEATTPAISESWFQRDWFVILVLVVIALLIAKRFYYYGMFHRFFGSEKLEEVRVELPQVTVRHFYPHDIQFVWHGLLSLVGDANKTQEPASTDRVSPWASPQQATPPSPEDGDEAENSNQQNPWGPKEGDRFHAKGTARFGTIRLSAHFTIEEMESPKRIVFLKPFQPYSQNGFGAGFQHQSRMELVLEENSQGTTVTCTEKSVFLHASNRNLYAALLVARQRKRLRTLLRKLATALQLDMGNNTTSAVQ